jgi:hypothetical protein
MTVIANTTQPTETLVLSAKQTISRLRAANLRLHAYLSEGRFICRIVDKAGNVVSIASRSTLEGAVTIAVGNLGA